MLRFMTTLASTRPGFFARTRARAALFGTVLLIVIASAVGLHDWADQHLGAPQSSVTSR